MNSEQSAVSSSSDKQNNRAGALDEKNRNTFYRKSWPWPSGLRWLWSRDQYAFHSQNPWGEDGHGLSCLLLVHCPWVLALFQFQHSSGSCRLCHRRSHGLRHSSRFRHSGDHETVVAVWAGDGGTFDIGLQALSGAAERNEDFIYICNDNEGYMNTGTQRSSATPLFAWTTTTPVMKPKENPKKDIMAIMADHYIPYAATATLAYPEDFLRKMEKAKKIRGTRFIHLFSPCPPGWRIPSENTVKISRLAVRSRVFPLYEIENGNSYTLQKESHRVPVKDYLKLQGRFSHLTDAEVKVVQENVERAWERLLKKAEV